MALDNLRGGTKRVVEENTPLNNLRGGTKRVVIVDGGGGSVDYAKTVQRAETMPTADASNAGQQFLYSGESDATYTHGYIYENVATTTPASATGTQTTGSTLSDITVDGETFWEELEEYEIPQQTGDYAFTYNGGTGYWDYGDDYFDLSDFGVTYTGTPADSDVLTISVTAPSTTYAWTQINVQPAPSGLPDQTGQSGKFLTTDGTDASWATPEAIKVNTTATLAVADWSSNTQTVTVSGVKADSVVFVSPAPASASDYASAGILCTAQAANSLTFTCTTTPTNAITVNVICM